MPLQYDENNIFARIINKTLPTKIISENDYALSFFDISPKAKVHAIIIPKGQYINYYEFHSKALQNEIINFYDLINQTIHALNLKFFRLISNSNAEAGQTVYHYHMHLLGGEKLKEAP